MAGIATFLFEILEFCTSTSTQNKEWQDIKIGTQYNRIRELKFIKFIK